MGFLSSLFGGQNRDPQATGKSLAHFARTLPKPTSLSPSLFIYDMLYSSSDPELMQEAAKLNLARVSHRIVVTDWALHTLMKDPAQKAAVREGLLEALTESSSNVEAFVRSAFDYYMPFANSEDPQAAFPEGFSRSISPGTEEGDNKGTLLLGIGDFRHVLYNASHTLARNGFNSRILA